MMLHKIIKNKIMDELFELVLHEHTTIQSNKINSNDRKRKQAI